MRINYTVEISPNIINNNRDEWIDFVISDKMWDCIDFIDNDKITLNFKEVEDSVNCYDKVCYDLKLKVIPLLEFLE